ncbi:MAG TPA: ABC transporter ATP-binding protein [Firmicutes bacterium]|jgi:ABC-type glutathione transport system ATPase component|nr:ABC transporter ATP-binding protein [Bacillota bacterium]
MTKWWNPNQFDYYVTDLTVTYRRRTHTSAASELILCSVSLGLNRGQVTAVIGESGSGKTTLAQAFLGALPTFAVATYAQRRLPERLGFIQQEAHASLHPTVKVGEQVNDVLATAQGLSPTAARTLTLSLFNELGLTPAEQLYDRYAHQISGGQAQRIALARALAMNAELLIADEPTSQLDMVAQAEAVKAIDKITRERGLSTLFVTHNLALVAELADWVLVLKEGQAVEWGAVLDVWHKPQHPYTKQLIGGTGL